MSESKFDGKSFIIGVSTASILISIGLGLTPLILEQKGLKLIDKDAVLYKEELNTELVDKADVEQNYIEKSVVESAYLAKADVAANYVKKAEMDKVLDTYLPKADVVAQYVIKNDYVDLKKKYDDLNSSINTIPTPFKPLYIKLGSTNNWHDDRFGVDIQNVVSNKISDTEIQASFKLKTPNSDLTEIEVNDFDYKFFISRFVVLNRTFEVTLSDLTDMTFLIKEI